MRDVLVALSVAATVPFVIKRPHIGVLVFAWLSYMNPHRLTWGFAYHFQFAFLIALLTLAAWLISREPKRVPLTATTVLLALFTAWFSLTTAFALVPDTAVEKWEQAVKIMAMTFVTMALINTRERLHQLLWVIGLSIAFYGLRGGVFAVLTAGQYRVWGPPDSFMADNNNLALALIMALPLLYYLYHHTDRVWLRRSLLALMPLSVLATLATYSRGGFLTLGAFMVVMWWKSSHKLVISALGVVALVLGLTFMPPQWGERISSIGDYEQDASAQSRFEAWAFAYRMAEQRPVLGGGFGVFRLNGVVNARGQHVYRTAHSVYFEVLGEHGFVGLGLFLALFGSGLLLGRRIIRRSRGDPELAWAGDLAAALQVSLIGFAVGGTFLNMAFFDLAYHVLAILIITSALVDQRLRAAAGKGVTPATARHRPPAAAPGRAAGSGRTGALPVGRT